jgi:mevalonate kinase
LRRDYNNEYNLIVQELARINNHLLIALGVGHAKVDQICTLLARYGFHAKMTGAGGGTRPTHFELFNIFRNCN